MSLYPAHRCPTYPCPFCHPCGYHYTMPVLPRGCICPAGAEKTCQGGMCPRRERTAFAAGPAGAPKP